MKNQRISKSLKESWRNVEPAERNESQEAATIPKKSSKTPKENPLNEPHKQ